MDIRYLEKLKSCILLPLLLCFSLLIIKRIVPITLNNPPTELSVRCTAQSKDPKNVNSNYEQLMSFKHKPGNAMD